MLAYGQAAEWVYGQAITPASWGATGVISLTEVRHIHEMTVGPVWEFFPPTILLLTRRKGRATSGGTISSRSQKAWRLPHRGDPSPRHRLAEPGQPAARRRRAALVRGAAAQ